ncbi:hypothetical protein [Streptomyces sp. V3I8]|uniref:hypothetical protein n=1 Tax=Streptomyces sp. V3I8 TaxID=3042279 RepID=UPI0027D90C75|nr:hypothetical protein [Streptomyces sp. V3I8]
MNGLVPRGSRFARTRPGLRAGAGPGDTAGAEPLGEQREGGEEGDHGGVGDGRLVERLWVAAIPATTAGTLKDR